MNNLAANSLCTLALKGHRCIHHGGVDGFLPSPGCGMGFTSKFAKSRDRTTRCMASNEGDIRAVRGSMPLAVGAGGTGRSGGTVLANKASSRWIHNAVPPPRFMTPTQAFECVFHLHISHNLHHTLCSSASSYERTDCDLVCASTRVNFS
jgi:hypothetical protein